MSPAARSGHLDRRSCPLHYEPSPRPPNGLPVLSHCRVRNDLRRQRRQEIIVARLACLTAICSTYRMEPFCFTRSHWYKLMSIILSLVDHSKARPMVDFDKRFATVCLGIQKNPPPPAREARPPQNPKRDFSRSMPRFLRRSVDAISPLIYDTPCSL